MCIKVIFAIYLENLLKNGEYTANVMRFIFFLNKLIRAELVFFKEKLNQIEFKDSTIL